MNKIIFLLGFIFLYGFSQAQNGLENVIVEKYYIANAADAAGSVGALPVGSVTYRIYVDMLPGYKFQMAYGNATHNLKLETTTSFFNNEDYGSTTPSFTKTNAAKNTVMLDSWLSVGAACNGNFGVLKSEDNGVTNTVNTNGILANSNPIIGLPLTSQDGFFTGTPQTVTFVGINNETNVFDNVSQSGNSFTLSNAAWSALSGATGATSSNRILIAQITTDGIFHYELNIQLGTPGGDIEKYVVSSPLSDERTIPSLQGTFYAPVTATISSPDTTSHVAQTVTVPVRTTGLIASNNVISYQFNLSFDQTKLQYVNNNLTGTIASSGTVTVNNSTPGQLQVSYMTSTALTGAGSLLNLQFTPLTIGTFPVTISQFLYNTDTIHGGTNGSITAYGMMGDIDTNQHIQAYDAALALQYSVGLDPLPVSDPLPWENWRLIVANVDGTNPVSANDASLILQYSAGLIASFPAGAKSLEDPIADITISQINNEIVLTSTGDFYGLNIYSTNGTSVTMGTPVVVDQNMMSATNIAGSTYNVGLCSATSPSNNTEVLRIPFTCTGSESLTFNMIINKNAVTKSIAVDCPLGIAENKTQSVNIYPNPATSKLNVEVSENSTVQLMDINGKQIIIEKNINADQKVALDVANLANGIYVVKISNEKFVKVQRVVINK